QLVDGFDKMASIFLTSDWPRFARYRDRMRREYGSDSNPQMKAAPQVIGAIRERGPLSSIDFKRPERIQSDWGIPTTLARAALEILHAMGEVVVDHRVGTRKAFDLAERLLPAELISAPDPIEGDSDYQAWRVMRRIGGIGLASPTASDYWLAMHQMKSVERRPILTRLVEAGELVVVAVEGLPDQRFFARPADLSTLEAHRVKRSPQPKASFIAPLDNLMWQRDLLRAIFEFDYVWEVYKPARQRRYGYYVLPVLYGDRFVARFDPKFDRTAGELTIVNWWWEDGVRMDERMSAGLQECLRDFMRYLGASRIRRGPAIARDRRLRWLTEVQTA
ncbi:MAG: DNA glycosylase AlkZ-like family protein, partial [Anaerolineales bacterium]